MKEQKWHWWGERMFTTHPRLENNKTHIIQVNVFFWFFPMQGIILWFCLLISCFVAKHFCFSIQCNKWAMYSLNVTCRRVVYCIVNNIITIMLLFFFPFKISPVNSSICLKRWSVLFCCWCWLFVIHLRHIAAVQGCIFVSCIYNI